MWLNYSEGSDSGVFTLQISQRTGEETLAEAAGEAWQKARGRIQNLDLLFAEGIDLDGTPATQFLAAFKGSEQYGLTLIITALTQTSRLVGSATVKSSDPRRLLALGQAAEAIGRSIRLSGA